MTGRVIDFWHRVTTIANAFGVHIDTSEPCSPSPPTPTRLSWRAAAARPPRALPRVRARPRPTHPTLFRGHVFLPFLKPFDDPRTRQLARVDTSARSLSLTARCRSPPQSHRSSARARDLAVEQGGDVLPRVVGRNVRPQGICPSRATTSGCPAGSRILRKRARRFRGRRGRRVV